MCNLYNVVLSLVSDSFGEITFRGEGLAKVQKLPNVTSAAGSALCAGDRPVVWLFLFGHMYVYH